MRLINYNRKYLNILLIQLEFGRMRRKRVNLFIKRNLILYLSLFDGIKKEGILRYDEITAKHLQ